MLLVVEMLDCAVQVRAGGRFSANTGVKAAGKEGEGILSEYTCSYNRKTIIADKSNEIKVSVQVSILVVETGRAAIDAHRQHTLSQCRNDSYPLSVSVSLSLLLSSTLSQLHPILSFVCFIFSFFFFSSLFSPSQTMTHISQRVSSVTSLTAPTPAIIPPTSLCSRPFSGSLVAKTALLPP